MKDAFSSYEAFIFTTFTFQASKKAPPAKRAKKDSGASDAKGSRQKKKSLSLLPTMPLDLLFEV